MYMMYQTHIVLSNYQQYPLPWTPNGVNQRLHRNQFLCLVSIATKEIIVTDYSY